MYYALVAVLSDDELEEIYKAQSILKIFVLCYESIQMSEGEFSQPKHEREKVSLALE